LVQLRHNIRLVSKRLDHRVDHVRLQQHVVGGVEE
jgi:hypothetical protein